MNYPRRHFLALIAALLLWGLSFPILRIALRTNGPLAITFYRYGMALLLVLPPLFFDRRRADFSVLHKHKGLLLLGVFNWAGSVLQFAGLRRTTAIKSAVLTQLLVVAVPIVAFWLLRERLSLKKFAAIFLSLAGAITLSTNLEFKGIAGGSTLAGDALTVLAVLFWAFFIVLSRSYAQRVAGYWLLLANYLSTFGLAALTTIPVANLGIDRVGILACIFLAVFCTVIPTMLYNFSLKEVEATASAIAGPLETISAGILAMLLIGERLTWTGAGGVLLIFFSIYLVAIPGKKKES